MKPALKRSGSGTGASSAPSKPRPGKPIMKTLEMLRSNEQFKRSGKGKEKGLLKGLSDVMQVHNNLPGAVQVERFAEARAMEVSALQTAVKIAAASNTSRAFQSLPRHLRRRAASHNPRRVPKYLKDRAAAEIDPGDDIVRRQRRKDKIRARGNAKGQSRTQQLRLRQRGKAWLATHMYHAKRFHMMNIWGYRLPRTPTLKSFRSSQRAARRKATLRDTSYFGVIELVADRERLVKLLGSVTGGTPCAGPRYESGSHSAPVNLYEPGAFPRSLIGPAEVLWKPSATSQAEQATAWVRVHPSIFQEAWKALASQSGDDVRMRDLRSELESFELIGPSSGSAILRSLPFSPSEPVENSQSISSVLSRDVAEIPDNLVLSFNAIDPRLSYPPCHLSHDGETTSGDRLGVTQRTEIWSRDCRSKLSKPTFSKAELDERRRRAGVPGRRLRPTGQDNHIPILIVKRQIGSEQERSAMFHGYTILFPRGWSMMFLPSFVYCGVKLVGVSEAEAIHREAGIPSFPEHYGSVCAAGKQSEDTAARDTERRWLRKPPGKRIDFSALDVDQPFKPDWESLFRNSSDESAAEAMEQPWLLDASLIPIVKRLALSKDPKASLMSAVNTFRQRRGLDPLPKEQAASLFNSCLCHVTVDVLGRGSPADMAMLYSVSAEERCKWLQALEDVKSNPDSAASEQLREEWNGRRDIIGFVTTGNISFTRGKGHGLATVFLSAYLKLLQSGHSQIQPELPVVLFRNRNSFTCRVAALHPVQSP